MAINRSTLREEAQAKNNMQHAPKNIRDAYLHICRPRAIRRFHTKVYRIKRNIEKLHKHTSNAYMLTHARTYYSQTQTHFAIPFAHYVQINSQCMRVATHSACVLCDVHSPCVFDIARNLRVQHDNVPQLRYHVSLLPNGCEYVRFLFLSSSHTL